MIMYLFLLVNKGYINSITSKNENVERERHAEGFIVDVSEKCNDFILGTLESMMRSKS